MAHETAPKARLRLRIVLDAGTRLGPGKADLLEQIGQTGSIAAAGRAMGMSYKRAWLLVEEMNAAFCAPLVVRVRGGASGGGTALTETGHEVLHLYRSLEARTAEVGAAELERLIALAADPPGIDEAN